MATKDLLESTKDSLERMQRFDVRQLARTDELGRSLSFEDAIPFAKKLTELYQRLGTSVIEDLTDTHLTAVKSQADADYSRFKSILDFSTGISNPQATRDQYISQLEGAYDTTFNALWQYIAYGVSKAIDSQRLENESRAVLQGISDQAERITSSLQESEKAANSTLNEIRRVAAEQGVSQKAIHFNTEAELHKGLAATWKTTTIRAALYSSAAPEYATSPEQTINTCDAAGSEAKVAAAIESPLLRIGSFAVLIWISLR